VSAAELSRAWGRGNAEFLRRASDGTPTGDSLAYAAAFAAWEIEGGDLALGSRMLRYVYRRGYRGDAVILADLPELIAIAPDPEAWLRLAKDALTAEPDSTWARTIHAAAEQAVERKRRKATSSPAGSR
jgi:hypothetical protein